MPIITTRLLRRLFSKFKKLLNKNLAKSAGLILKIQKEHNLRTQEPQALINQTNSKLFVLKSKFKSGQNANCTTRLKIISI